MNLCATCRTCRRCSARADVQQLLRVGLAVLPVALVDLHRQLPARHQGVHQRRAGAGASASSTTAARSSTHSRSRCRTPGYRTAMMGKYLNGYGPLEGSVPGAAVHYVPPGWAEWDVAGWGYPEFNYSLNEDGKLHQYGNQPEDYLTDVMARKGVDFINSRPRPGSRSSWSWRRSRRISIHAGAARCRQLSRPAGAAAAQLRQAADRSVVGGWPPAARRAPDPADQHGLPSARTGRAVGRPDDRADRGGARRQRREPTTPTSCSAPTTDCTPASTA